MAYQASLIFLSICWHIHVYLNDVNKALVVDEVYHVPQAQKYCAGNFSYWDEKITTPPGLYLLSTGINRTLSSVRGVDGCSLFCLRLTNVVLLSTIPTLLLGIFRAKNRSLAIRDYFLAVSLPCLPVLFFTSFFYYTETLSVVLVLAVALFRYRKQHWLAAVFGLLSLTVRQTNVIWVGFFGADATIDAILRFCRCLAKEKKRKIDDAYRSPSLIKVLLKIITSVNWKTRFELLYNVLVVATPYLIVMGSFLGFLTWNGGVVVGDKQAHSVSTHTPQVLYFCIFTAALSWPYFLIEAQRLVSSMKTAGGWFLFLVLSGLCFLSFHFNSKVHPYLLADNRHYSFYIWKKILSKKWSRYVLIPLSALCARFLSSALRGTNDVNFLSKMTLLMAIISSLAFQELFDFRYFIIPFIVARLHFPSAPGGLIFTEMATYILINWATIYIYSKRTFRWSDLSDPQRIIW